jgi:hypothetical protein
MFKKTAIAAVAALTIAAAMASSATARRTKCAPVERSRQAAGVKDITTAA